MDIEKIRSLAEIMKSSGLTSLKIEDENLKIYLKRDIKEAATLSGLSPEPRDEEEVIKTSKSVKGIYTSDVKSPMIGTLYLAPSPDAEPYVQKGSKVKKGDVLCIIESMKLLNEIQAETDGEIADICVEDGQLVEYSQILFRIR